MEKFEKLFIISSVLHLFPGSAPIPGLERVLTGVAIADTGDSLSVYFGCYAEISGVGGLGLVRITANGTKKSVLPVRSANQKVYGGTLFLAHNVQTDKCNVAEGTATSTTVSTMQTTTARSTESSTGTSSTSPIFIPSKSSTQPSSTKYETVASTVSDVYTAEEPKPTTGTARRVSRQYLVHLLVLVIVMLAVA